MLGDFLLKIEIYVWAVEGSGILILILKMFIVFHFLIKFQKFIPHTVLIFSWFSCSTSFSFTPKCPFISTFFWKSTNIKNRRRKFLLRLTFINCKKRFFGAEGRATTETLLNGSRFLGVPHPSKAIVLVEID